MAADQKSGFLGAGNGSGCVFVFSSGASSGAGFAEVCEGKAATGTVGAGFGIVRLAADSMGADSAAILSAGVWDSAAAGSSSASGICVATAYFTAVSTISLR